MTDAALVRALVELRQQLTLSEQGTPALSPALLGEINRAVADIEAELHTREIDPAHVQDAHSASFPDGRVVRFVTLDEGD